MVLSFFIPVSVLESIILACFGRTEWRAFRQGSCPFGAECGFRAWSLITAKTRWLIGSGIDFQFTYLLILVLVDLVLFLIRL